MNVSRSRVSIVGMGQSLSIIGGHSWEEVSFVLIIGGGVIAVVTVIALSDGHPGCIKGSRVMPGGEDICSVGKHEVGGALVLVTNDVSCPVAECEICVLVVSSDELGHTVLNGQIGGVFSELVVLDYPLRVEVEELSASPGITGGAEEDAWRAFRDVHIVQWVRVFVYLRVCPRGELAVLRVVNLVAD